MVGERRGRRNDGGWGGRNGGRRRRRGGGGGGGGRGVVSYWQGKAGETLAGRYREDNRHRCVVDDEEDAVAEVKSLCIIGDGKGRKGGG